MINGCEEKGKDSDIKKIRSRIRYGYQHNLERIGFPTVFERGGGHLKYIMSS